ncbi:MAG: ParA family protein [Vibrio sp.]|uniref:ParA family protein n=1 Tax=Vibrio sp. TaxID=678 RepID=UPI003A8869E5
MRSFEAGKGLKYNMLMQNKRTISLHYSAAKKLLVMNQKGGVGKSTFVAGLISQLIQQGYKVELIDFDKQKSSHDWASTVIPEHSHAYNPSLRSFSDIAKTLRVQRDTDFVILDSPSNFTNEDMARYTYFVNAIILPMSPSPVDLHASLPFIKTIIDSGILSMRKIALSFVINRCTYNDQRVEKVFRLLQHFRHYPTHGLMSENICYQEAFYYKQIVPKEIDQELWDNVLNWLKRI